jgi:hypothetical protein
MEAIHRRWKISREHCHGGKFNGVNCIRIIEKSEEIFGEDGFTGVAMHVADTGLKLIFPSEKNPRTTKTSLES